MSALHKAVESGTFRLDDGSDYVLNAGETELAEGHPLVKARPELFESPRSTAKRRSTRKDA